MSLNVQRTFMKLIKTSEYFSTITVLSAHASKSAFAIIFFKIGVNRFCQFSMNFGNY